METRYIKKTPYIPAFIISMLFVTRVYATQIHTVSDILDMKWSLEKTSGTLSLSGTLKRKNQPKAEHTSAVIYYSGALFSLELEHFITIQSLTNFSFIKRPGGLPWSEYQYKIEDLYAVEIEERIEYIIPIAYKSDIRPFIGYSYLKLDYKPDYTVVPADSGHNVYHNFIVGLQYGIQVSRQFKTDAFALTSLLSYNYPLSSTKSRYLGYGGSFVFDFEYFGIRMFFSVKKTNETGESYSSYITTFHEIGFTFRILN